MMDKKKRVSVAGDSLEYALETLRASGSAETLYPEHRHRRGSLTKHEARVFGRENRLRYARTSVLFAAAAAEAYANHFIAQQFNGADADALDRLSTVNKLRLAPWLILGKELFARDRQPLQRITELFRLRDELMHPKSVLLAPDERLESVNSKAEERVHPEAAARYVLAVADTAVKLTTLHRLEDADHVALAVIDERAAIRRFGKRARAELPPVDEEPAAEIAPFGRKYRGPRGQIVLELPPNADRILHRRT